MPVFGNHRTVIGPATGVSGIRQPGQGQLKLATAGTGDAKMKPLEEFGIAILADTQPGARPVNRDNLDIARIESGADADVVHGTAIVSPDLPGKPANSAAASFGAPS